MKRRHTPAPSYMLTGSYFYAPVRAWVALGTFKHEPQPFGRNEVAASEQAARGRQTALENGATGTVTARNASRAQEAVAKASIQASRAANPRGTTTFTCAWCCHTSFIAGSKIRDGSRVCGTCGGPK